MRFYTSCVAIFEFTVTVQTIIVRVSSVLRNVTFTVQFSAAIVISVPQRAVLHVLWC